MASSATLTTTHLPELRAVLDSWDGEQPPHKGFAIPWSQLDPSKATKDIIVAFRTRPSLPNEAAEKFKRDAADSDVPIEFCKGITVTSAEPGVFVAHVPGMKWNGPTLAHKSYNSDLAFAPDIDNEEVYQRAVKANNILPLVLSGGVGCVLAYGQTGSGKTFTMEGIESCIARDLFEESRIVAENLIRGTAADTPVDQVFEFSITFLELLGKKATDLVEESTEVDVYGNIVRSDIPIHEDKVGNVCPRLISTIVKSSDELRELIVSSLAHRRTSATLRNASSSRSHALLTIRVKNTLLPYAQEGQLILVDLAGSERHEDSKEHDKPTMEQSRDNNKSLMNLKECVRAKAKMANEDGFVHIPWRSNKLTMLLKPVFDIESRQPSKTVIIAHVSPHIQDTVHSTNTLSYAAPFKTSIPKPRGPMPYEATDPRSWDHDQTHAWLVKMFSSRAQGEHPTFGVDIDKLCPAGMTAQNLGVLYTTQFLERCLNARVGDCSKEQTDNLKTVAVEIVGELFYLILSAKTRKRNAIMKSRKALEVDEAYGEAPKGPQQDLSEGMDADDYIDFREHFGDEWKNRIMAAIAKSTNENARYEARAAVIKEMVEEWTALKAARDAKETDL
ncbi:P-loop containing nucleoside triphosphate hydrolase protein [Mycena floridula]|nr:P-loop containing nucleoside triphosphate hydrolase protein [Mycena floridula]